MRLEVKRLKADKNEPKNMLRLVSLFLALLMWVNFSGRVDVSESDKTRVLSQVPLVYVDKPEAFRITNEYTFQSTIIVQGPRKVLDSISPLDIGVTLDLSGVRTGANTLPIMPEHVTLPQELQDQIQVVSVIPSQVTLNIDKYSQARVPLKLLPMGSPAEGYEVVSHRTIPEFVTLEGPSKRIDGVSMLLGESVSVDGATATLRGDFTVSSMPRDSYLYETDLRYEIVIREKMSRRIFDKSYVLEYDIAENQDGNWREWSQPPLNVSLEISGPESIVTWFDPEWVIPHVVMDTTDAVFSDPNETVEGVSSELRTQFMITSKWNLPEDVRTQYPDWLDRVARLDVVWSPDKVEVEKQ